MAGLEVRKLTKTFAAIPAVDALSFTVQPGEVLGVLGPNGAGKSTTVKMLTGLLEPSSGEILYDGQSVGRDLTAYKRGLGYVPDEPNLYTFLSGMECLELVATLRELDESRWRARAEAMLEQFGLYAHRHSAVSAYSRGMRQRLMWIAALLHDPALLILDEGFTGLDVTMTLVFRRMVSLLAAEGKAILFCSPVLEVVERVSTHVLILSRGRAVAWGAIDEVRAKGRLDGLEDRFLQLTEQVDADRLAHEIVQTVRG